QDCLGYVVAALGRQHFRSDAARPYRLHRAANADAVAGLHPHAGRHVPADAFCALLAAKTTSPRCRRITLNGASRPEKLSTPPAAERSESNVGRLIDQFEQRACRPTWMSLALLPVANGFDRHFDLFREGRLGQSAARAHMADKLCWIAVVDRLFAAVRKD